MKAQGIEVGKSLVEAKFLDQAKLIWAELKGMEGLKLLIPVDDVVTSDISTDAPVKTVPAGQIPADMMGVDIGPDTIKLFKDAVKSAGTVVWNGPLGIFENPKFARGTIEIAKARSQRRSR